MSVFAEQAAKNMQDAFAEFLFDPFKDGLGGMLEGFAQTLRKMAAELVAAKLFEKFNIEDMLKPGSLTTGPATDWLKDLFGIGDQAPELQPINVPARMTETTTATIAELEKQLGVPSTALTTAAQLCQHWGGGAADGRDDATDRCDDAADRRSVAADGDQGARDHADDHRPAGRGGGERWVGSRSSSPRSGCPRAAWRPVVPSVRRARAWRGCRQGRAASSRRRRTWEFAQGHLWRLPDRVEPDLGTGGAAHSSPDSLSKSSSRLWGRWRRRRDYESRRRRSAGARRRVAACWKKSPSRPSGSPSWVALPRRRP